MLHLHEIILQWTGMASISCQYWPKFPVVCCFLLRTCWATFNLNWICCSRSYTTVISFINQTNAEFKSFLQDPFEVKAQVVTTRSIRRSNLFWNDQSHIVNVSSFFNLKWLWSQNVVFVRGCIILCHGLVFTTSTACVYLGSRTVFLITIYSTRRKKLWSYHAMIMLKVNSSDQTSCLLFLMNLFKCGTINS